MRETAIKEVLPDKERQPLYICIQTKMQLVYHCQSS